MTEANDAQKVKNGRFLTALIFHEVFTLLRKRVRFEQW